MAGFSDVKEYMQDRKDDRLKNCNLLSKLKHNKNYLRRKSEKKVKKTNKKQKHTLSSRNMYEQYLGCIRMKAGAPSTRVHISCLHFYIQFSCFCSEGCQNIAKSNTIHQSRLCAVIESKNASTVSLGMCTPIHTVQFIMKVL